MSTHKVLPFRELQDRLDEAKGYWSNPKLRTLMPEFENYDWLRFTLITSIIGGLRKPKRISTILNWMETEHYPTQAHAVTMVRRYAVSNGIPLDEVKYLKPSADIHTYPLLDFNAALTDEQREWIKTNFTGVKTTSLSIAVETLVTCLVENPDYLNGWHANIACSALDEGVAYESAQRIASRFLSNLTEGAANSLANHNKLNGQNIK